MELHRLKELNPNLDLNLFNRLLEDTKPLRRKLVSEINPRLVGESQDIIDSWFIDKLLWAFQKYYEKYPEGEAGNCKGYVIQALRTFKLRVLRKCYQDSVHHHTIEIDQTSTLVNIIPDKEEVGDKELFIELATSFMKKHLSDNAYMLFEIELNPPPYILSRVNNPNTKIPQEVILEYLGLNNCPDNYNTVNQLRREVKNAIYLAREHFKSKDLSLV